MGCKVVWQNLTTIWETTKRNVINHKRQWKQLGGLQKKRTFPLEPSFSNPSLPQRCLVCIYTADVFSAHEIYIFLLLRNRFFILFARFPSKDSQTNLEKLCFSGWVHVIGYSVKGNQGQLLVLRKLAVNIACRAAHDLLLLKKRSWRTMLNRKKQEIKCTDVTLTWNISLKVKRTDLIIKRDLLNCTSSHMQHWKVQVKGDLSCKIHFFSP